MNENTVILIGAVAVAGYFVYRGLKPKDELIYIQTADKKIPEANAPPQETWGVKRGLFTGAVGLGTAGGTLFYQRLKKGVDITEM